MRLRLGLLAPSVLVLAVGQGWGAPLPAGLPVVVRGPYLQLGTPDSVIVRWRTSLPTDSRVRFGFDSLAPAALDRVADVAGERTDHSVKLTGLAPGTRYRYTVGSASDTLACLDGSCTFETPPPAGTAKPTRIWVLGDSGTKGAEAASVRDSFVAFNGGHPPDLWLMLGDNAYETGTDAEYQAAVFDMYPNLLKALVLWPALGNHDAFNAQVFLRAFDLPAAGEAGGLPSGTETYYSFDYGTVHFVCLDSAASSRLPGSPMLTWLRADLARNRLPWVIAYWHHPPYSKGSHDSDAEIELVEMRQGANPILEEAGVDLVLAGHSHAYERTVLLDRHYGPSTSLVPGMILDGGDGRAGGNGPYRKGTGPHEGTVYVVAGVSGRLGVLRQHPAMVSSLAVLGSLVIDVDGDRLDVAFLQADGRLGDRFSLLKTLPPPPPPPETTVTFTSIPAQDGYLVEANEGSGSGGGAEANLAAGGALRVGDLARDRQLRSLVSFDTSALPDGATIAGARLRLARGAVAGSDPFASHGRCRVEVRRGVFGGSRALVAADFQAPATAPDGGTLAPLAGLPVAEAVLNAEGLAALNKSGTTQIRLSFLLGDDDDGAADYAGFFAGEAQLDRRPQLIVTYR